MRRGRKPATFGPEHLAALAFADEDDEIRSCEAADLLGVTANAVSTWIRAGQITARKDLGARGHGVYLMRVADLRAFVAARSEVSA